MVVVEVPVAAPTAGLVIFNTFALALAFVMVVAVVLEAEREETVVDAAECRELAAGVPMLVVSPKWT